MDESKFTPTAEEALQLLRKPRANWGTAIWEQNICCWA